MAVQYCNYDIKGTLAVDGTSTLSGIVTITEATSNPLLNIYNTSNGGGATIRFSDQTSQTQVGDITFYHSDSSSQGGGASWHFVSEPDTVLVVGSGSVNGRFVAKSAGSVAEVDYGFFDDVNTGMYRAATDTVRLAGGGVYNLSVSNTNAALYYQSGLRFQTTSSGAKVEGGLVIEGATDSILTLNQTGTDTGWSYINFNTLGTRNYYVGQDASKNFNIYNDNIDVIAISVSYTSNLTTIGGDLTVTGGDIILSGTGRIQGVDTVSTSTDATNKAYVDSAVSGAGVGTFLPLSGGVLTGNVRWNDAKAALFGSGQDMHIYHYLGQNYIDTYNGNLILTSHETDADIIFKSDNGSGGVTEYFRLDGSSARTIFTRNTQHVDNSKAIFGNGDDLQIYHDGTDSYIDQTGTGDLVLRTSGTGDDVFIRAIDDIFIQPKNGEAGVNVLSDGAVELYYDGNKRLETTSAGITVTGGGTFSTSVTASGNSNSFGNTTIAALSATSGSFSSSVTAAGNSNSFGTTTFTGNIVMGDNDITGIDQLIFTSGSYFDDVGSSNYIRLKYNTTTGGGLRVEDNAGHIGGYLYSDGSTTSSFGLLDGTGAWAVRCLENQYVELRYDNAAKFQTLTDGVYVAGKLGIGTSTPDTDGYSFAEDLVIKGGASASDGAGITIAGNGKRYGIIAFGDTADPNAGEIFYDHNVNAMYFRTNGSNSVVFINSAGKVTAGAATGSSDGSSTLTTKGYVDAQISSIPSGLNFQGNWNASTNSPTLASGTGTPGFYYNVSVAGTTDLDGETDWQVGDWAVFVENGTNDFWEKIDNTSALTGVGANNQVSIWGGTNTLEGSTNLTFTGGSLYVTGDGNSAQWAEAYNNQITAISDSGSSTITLTLTQEDGGTLTTSFSNPQGNVTTGGLTSGRIPFANSSVNLDNSADLAWDDTNKKLVIGQPTSQGASGTVIATDGRVYIEDPGTNWNETTPGLTQGSLHFDPQPPDTNNIGNAITFGASDAGSGTTAHAGIYTRYRWKLWN